MARFPVAWCEEERECLSPLDVCDLWRHTRKEPFLQCPDEQCRKENPAARIIPVCCNPEAPCKKMTPYFRTGPEHPHRKGCHYAELAEAVEYILAHRKEFVEDADTNLLKNLKGIADTSLLPDGYLTAYDPKTELEKIEREAAKRIRDGSSRQKAIRLARASIPHKTGSLKRIVEMCELLDKTGERELVPLSIPGRIKAATYKNAFFPVHKLHSDYRTAYIFYGCATIKKEKNGYLVVYSRELRHYHQDFPNLRAVMPIKQEACKKMLTRELEYYAATQVKCCVYTFCSHALKKSNCPLSESKSCVFLSPKVSDAIVVRENCLEEDCSKEHALTTPSETRP